MGRLVSWLLALAVLAYIAFWTVNHLAGSVQQDPEGSSQAKAILDRAREQAKQIEKNEARRADETLRRTDETR
jgi:uncharacterized membrane protein